MLPNKDVYYIIFYIILYTICIILYNLCNSFKHDLHCASPCGVDFVLAKEGAAEVMFEMVTEITISLLN